MARWRLRSRCRHGVPGLSFIDVEVREAPDSEIGQGDREQFVSFVLRDTGIVTFPSLEFSQRDEALPDDSSSNLLVGSAVRTGAIVDHA